MSDLGGATYAAEAGLADEVLDVAQASIRRRAEAGEITWAEAADERVRVMEDHLAVIRRLRVKHFGGEE